MKRAPKVMILVHPQMRPDRHRPKGATELDIWKALKFLGCQVEVTSLRDDLHSLDAALAKHKPKVVFNLLEEFRGEGVFDFHAVSFLEARGIPYTGCNPRGLIVSRNKSWATQIAYGSGVKVPESFRSSPRFPVFVKYLREHASRGLTLRSRANSARELAMVRALMKRKYPGEIAIQEFVRGEDVTVSLLGNARTQALPPWRLNLGGIDRFATERIKFNPEMRRRNGIRSYRYKGQATEKLISSARLLYKAFDLSGYARLDFRVTLAGEAFFIDVNANPNLAKDEDFACAARFAKKTYPELIKEIMSLACIYRPRI